MIVRCSPRCLVVLTAFAASCFASSETVAAEPLSLPVRVTGLFSKDREEDFRDLLKEIPDVELKSLDFDHAEATFHLKADSPLAKGKRDEVIARLDNQVRQSSNSTFGVKPPSDVPREKLKRVEIGVVGLDCKACCLAVYEVVARVDGVVQATASFKDGRVSALIDPTKTDQKQLEDALRKRNVAVK